jgi:multidrug resistance efflux pump
MVEMRELQRTLSLSGSLSPVLQATVRSKVPASAEGHGARGRPGHGRPGDRHARFDRPASRRSTRSSPRSRRRGPKETIARKNRENNQALLRQNFISQNAYDTAASTYEGAAAACARPKRRCASPRRPARTPWCAAPFAGLVSRRMANVGEKVAVDAPMFTIVDLGRMEIEAPAPAAEIPGVKVGQLAQFRVDGFGEPRLRGPHRAHQPVRRPGIAFHHALRRHPESRRGA